MLPVHSMRMAQRDETNGVASSNMRTTRRKICARKSIRPENGRSGVRFTAESRCTIFFIASSLIIYFTSQTHAHLARLIFWYNHIQQQTPSTS